MRSVGLSLSTCMIGRSKGVARVDVSLFARSSEPARTSSALVSSIPEMKMLATCASRYMPTFTSVGNVKLFGRCALLMSVMVAYTPASNCVSPTN